MKLNYQTEHLLFILVFIALVFSGIGYGTEAQVASTKKVTSIPFDFDANLIFLPVSINGSKPLSFILDTGSYSMISTSRAKSLGLNLQLVGRTDGIGDNQQNVYVVTGKTPYGPPGAVLNNQRLLSVPLEQVEDCFNRASKNQLGEATQTTKSTVRKQRAVDGILGKEFFDRFVVEIDYESRIINLYEPATFVYGGKGEHFELTISPQHIFVRAKVKASGRAALEGRFQVDTGYPTALVLTKEFVAANQLMPPVEQLKRIPKCGLAGFVKDQSWEGSLERLELGSFRIDNPATEFSQSQFNQDFDGFIGEAALKRFKVIFDYSRKEMILEESAQPVRKGDLISKPKL